MNWGLVNSRNPVTLTSQSCSSKVSSSSKKEGLRARNGSWKLSTSHSFIDLFVHSLHKYSLNPHSVFGPGPGSKETKVSPTQATELKAFAQRQKTYMYMDDENKGPQIPTEDKSREDFPSAEQHRCSPGDRKALRVLSCL